MKTYTKFKRELLKYKNIKVKYDKLKLEFICKIAEALDARIKISINSK